MSHGLFYTMSLKPFWDLNALVELLSMQGQKAFGFHKKYLNLCLKMHEGLMGFESSFLGAFKSIFLTIFVNF